ncbi:MAG: hypothetical protein ACT443_03480 [Gemmatimonadota bacterium]
MRKRVVVSWSGGKDSAMALHDLLRADELEVAALLTATTAQYDRISMHGVRAALLRRQCAALNLPLLTVSIPPVCTNAEYEAAFSAQLRSFAEAGIGDLVFGDIFLRDVRAYRERLLNQSGMTCHFPLWSRDSGELARGFIAAGFRAVLVCVDSVQLPAEFCSREYDEQLLRDLPGSCDPCGERGEFHTFVYDGPIFDGNVAFERGEIVGRGNFYFCDLSPATELRTQASG